MELGRSVATHAQTSERFGKWMEVQVVKEKGHHETSRQTSEELHSLP